MKGQSLGKSEKMIIEKENKGVKSQLMQSELERLNRYQDSTGVPLNRITSEVNELLKRTLSGKEGITLRNQVQKIKTTVSRARTTAVPQPKQKKG